MEHVTRVGERGVAYRFCCGNLKKRDHLEDLGINGRITLKLILKIGW
jgi:hypothetical protein